MRQDFVIESFVFSNKAFMETCSKPFAKFALYVFFNIGNELYSGVERSRK